MEENFNNVEDFEIEGKETPKPKKAIKWHIIIPIISIIVIGIIVFIIVFKLKDDDNDDDNNNNVCEIGDEDKCHICNGNKCVECNYRYELIKGKCKANFSFRAIYSTNTENESIDLINSIYKDYIIEMEIDEEKVSPTTKYTFISSENHTAYFTMNIEN